MNQFLARKRKMYLRTMAKADARRKNEIGSRASSDFGASVVRPSNSPSSWGPADGMYNQHIENTDYKNAINTV